MTEGNVIDIVRHALVISATLAGPALIVSLVIGIVVSLVQTVTQIQEATLTFVPKLIGAAVLLLFAGGWMLQMLTDYVVNLWGSIPSLV